MEGLLNKVRKNVAIGLSSAPQKIERAGGGGDIIMDDFDEDDSKSASETLKENGDGVLKLSSSLESGLGKKQLYLASDGGGKGVSPTPLIKKLGTSKKTTTSLQDLLSNKKKRKLEEEDLFRRNIHLSGEKWFGMKGSMLTDEVKTDLEIIRLRSLTNRACSANSSEFHVKFNKFLHYGTVMEGGADYFSSRIKKKDRRNTIVDSLLADENLAQFTAAAQREKKEKAYAQDVLRKQGLSKAAQRIMNPKKTR